MSKRFFTFVKKEYDKYENFDKVDPELDYRTSTFISRDVVAAVNRARRMSESINLQYGEEQYATHTSAVAFYRGLMSHLALRYWQPKVKSLELEDEIWNSPGASMLLELGKYHPIQGLSTMKFSITMSRSTSGILEMPSRDLRIFSMQTIFEYCIPKWLLSEGHTYFKYLTPQLEFRLQQNEQYIDMELQRMHDIIEKGY